jgi:hypothetical protein
MITGAESGEIQTKRRMDIYLKGSRILRGPHRQISRLFSLSKNEEYHLPRYNAVSSVECQPTFRRNVSPSCLGSKK